jgi:AraC family transcriptional regulator
MSQDYEKRIRRVLQHIYDHPDGDLSLDALADVAAMSRFHWHRVFHGMTGETCAQAVRRLRAHRAACWLVQTDWPVAQVARRAGYDNVQSFARLFRQQFGMTPKAFRAAGRPDSQSLTFRKGPVDMYPVEILENQSPTRLATLPHRGAYTAIGSAFEQLGAMMAARNLWPQVKGMIGVYYDDPDAVAEADLRSSAGVIVGDDFAMPEDLQEIRLQGGRHAVLTFTGPYSGLKPAYEWMFGSWLPQSGQELGDAPCFELYLNSPMDTAPADLITKIYVPLA